MKILLQIVLTLFILSSCWQKDNEDTGINEEEHLKDGLVREPNYSVEFLTHFQESEMTLRGDSILFPKEAGSEVVIIPKYIPKNQQITFEAENGEKISIRQLNYTDIQFVITHNSQEFNGKASLSPYFYLGTETVDFSDGEYLITHYYVTESDTPCLHYIGIGNENLSNEYAEDVYAMVAVFDDSCENGLLEVSNKKLKVLAVK